MLLAPRKNSWLSKEENKEKRRQMYDQAGYWNKRYGIEMEPFEWFQKYEGKFREVLLSMIPKNSKVLVIGCGNSGFLKLFFL